MKKIIAILLAFTLLLLTSCGNSSVTTEQTTETASEGFCGVQPVFNTIDGLLAAARGEGEPDNMDASFNSFEFPDYDKVIYPICNLEEFHLVNVSLWNWGYQYWFITEDELTSITVNVRMVDGEMPTEGEPLENGAYRNDQYVYVPYGDTYYSIHFPRSYTEKQRTPDVVTMVSVDIPQ